MTYNEESQAALDLAHCIKQRVLGNDDDQRICPDQPSRVYDFGILFSCHDAQASRTGDRSIFKPHSLSMRFEVPSHALHEVKLEVCPSFWLYFRRACGEEPPEDWGELYDPTNLWQDWHDRVPTSFVNQLTPRQYTQSSHQQPSENEEQDIRRFVRRRYARCYSGSINELSEIPLDLEQFRETYTWLGDKTPRWRGSLSVQIGPGLASDRSMLEVRLSNEYDGSAQGEPAWFDVMLRARVYGAPVLHTYCPLLDSEARVEVQTVNCVLSTRLSQIDEGIIVVEQVGEVIRHRQTMRDAVTFSDARTHPQVLLDVVEQIAQEADLLGSPGEQHAEALREACQAVRDDEHALHAIEVVAEVFGRAFPEGSFWRRHQVVTFLLAAASYIHGARRLEPLIVNVPTAGGKTEAFTAAALWSAAYEHFRSNRLGVCIIKYPTTLLSDDQASRLAKFAMLYDQVMMERDTQKYPRLRGLGLFFGPDREPLDPVRRVGATCPICGEAWAQRTKAREESGTLLRCPRDHQLLVAVHDEVFYQRPVLIVSTLHKFVSKARKGLMRILLGGETYWCEHKQQITDKPYCSNQNPQTRRYERLPHGQMARRALVTMVVLDEAHLIREDTGALASHFESHYLELIRELGGRYPQVVVSTATIAAAKRHAAQVGLGRFARLFPGRRGENDALYYEATGQVKHVILACMPRGRAVAWALPHLIGDYADVIDAEGGRFVPFYPILAYCGTYYVRDMVRDGIRRHVNDERRNRGEHLLNMDEFSRRRFNEEGIDAVLSRLEEGNLHVILSTNIASVGVDFPNLRAIAYSRIPTSVSEFIQSLNRIARQDPGVAILVLDPYKERDCSYYAYLHAFVRYPERIVEAVPLNRYARTAINTTFDTLAIAQLGMIWTPRVQGLDLRRPAEFGRARGRQLRDGDVTQLLERSYRASHDPSGAYPERVRTLWASLAQGISQYRPRGRRGPDFPYGDNWIWFTPDVKTVWNLIPDRPQGELDFPTESEILRRARGRYRAGVVHTFEQDEPGNLRDDEFDVVDGASEDFDVLSQAEGE